MPLLLLPVAVWLTYFDAIQRGGYVSDDFAGIVFTDESRSKLYLGELRRPLSFHNILRFIRWHIGKGPNPNVNWKKDKQPQFLSDPRKHHRLNVILLSGIAPLLYLFLCNFMDSRIAFLAILLFIAHPVGTQVIAWISGIGYLLSLFFILIALNIVYLTQGWMAFPLGFLGALTLYLLFHYLSVTSMFASIGVTLLLLFLHQWPFAIASIPVTFLACFTVFRDAVILRKKVFKEQQMEESTRFHLRKVLVAFKTLWYYSKTIFFPKRLGLYHIWGYYYETPYIEWEDRDFWYGVAVAVGLAALLILAPFPAKLAVIWYIAFMFLFLNWVTINQFVVDRYCWLPSLGAALLVAWACFTYQLLPLYWVILGCLLARTWFHLPSYQNEEQFYLSNLYNFPNSEVAMGNLGVVYLQSDRVSNALEYWVRGCKQNPEYDVNWYNLASLMRARGPFNPYYAVSLFNLMPEDIKEKSSKRPDLIHLYMARHCLQQAVSARSCHFPAMWEKELSEIDGKIAEITGKVIRTTEFKPLPEFLRA